LKKGRIEVPVRSVNCRPHLECFDLRTFLDCESKNSATVGATTSARRSQRPLWACPVCGERARAEDLRVDGYFVHILEVVPPNVVEVQLLEDRSFEQIAAVEPEVTLSDDEPFEPQAGQLDIAPSGPSRVLEGMMKQSKAFQGTLQDGRTFRTKKALLDRVESFLEDQRDAISALLKKLSSAKQGDVGTCSTKKLCVLDSRACQREKPADANGTVTDTEKAEVDHIITTSSPPPRPPQPREKQHTLFEKRLEVVAFANKHGDAAAAARFGSDSANVAKWRKKEAAYKRELEDTVNVKPFLHTGSDEVTLPIYLADIERKVHENRYQDERSFVLDFKTMFAYCYHFNRSDSAYYEMCYNLNKTFLALCMQHFPSSTLLPQLPEQKPNAMKP
ncbi:CBN-PCAF-1 protein, partial [Aphelenchoides avenae]